MYLSLALNTCYAQAFSEILFNETRLALVAATRRAATTTSDLCDDSSVRAIVLPQTLSCCCCSGVLPMALTAYPYFSKLFNSPLCRWTAAPILFRLPVIRNIIKASGIIPAKADKILTVLSKVLLYVSVV